MLLANSALIQLTHCISALQCPHLHALMIALAANLRMAPICDRCRYRWCKGSPCMFAQCLDEYLDLLSLELTIILNGYQTKFRTMQTYTSVARCISTAETKQNHITTDCIYWMWWWCVDISSTNYHGYGSRNGTLHQVSGTASCSNRYCYK